MESGSFLGAIVGGSILLFLGALVAFAGYRLFLVLLPIYGFFFGLTFGAHSVQALFGDGFLSTTSSWVVGFFVGLAFALLSYLFWVVAVAIASGSLAYSLVAALFSLFEADLSVIVWVLGVGVGIVFAIAAIVMNLQKAVIIVATSLAGAWSIVGTFRSCSPRPRRKRSPRAVPGWSLTTTPCGSSSSPWSPRSGSSSSSG